MAAGTAIYEALPLKSASKNASPFDKPKKYASIIAILALNIGINIAKNIKKEPSFLSSYILFAATSPISSKKKANIPLNKAPNNGSIEVQPLSPVKIPINKAPINKNTEGFKKASLRLDVPAE